MRSLITLFSLVASACAYQILTPSNSSGWTTTGSNIVTWSRVSTDPTNFTMLLVNQDKSVLPSGEEVLIATVDGTQSSITVPAPSGGFQVATGYQVNFVKDPEDLSTILAQSNQFSITQSNSTSSTTTSPSNTAVTPAVTNAAQTTATDTDSSGDINPTASANTTTKNGADRVTAAGSTGLIFAALAAFFL
jgi:hypothetical protein